MRTVRRPPPGAASLLLAAALLAAPAGATSPLAVDDFEAGRKAAWQEKEFRGRTEYRVVLEPGGNHALRAEARGAASGLVYEVAFDPREYPILAWRWKVENLVTASDPSRKVGDDYPARVYVVFPHWFPPKTRSLNYIWATGLPQGAQVPNPFFANAVMIAAQSGPALLGRWVEERRDLIADYRRAFGEDPPRAGAIAVMTDTDQTGETAVGWYDDLRLEAR